jgi:hypothetical protein
MAGFMRCTICNITSRRQYQLLAVQRGRRPLPVSSWTPPPCSRLQPPLQSVTMIVRLTAVMINQTPKSTTSKATMQALGHFAPATRDSRNVVPVVYHGPRLRFTCRVPTSPQSHIYPASFTTAAFHSTWTASLCLFGAGGRRARRQCPSASTKHCLSSADSTDFRIVYHISPVTFLASVDLRTIRRHARPCTASLSPKLVCALLPDLASVLLCEQHSTQTSCPAEKGLPK